MKQFQFEYKNINNYRRELSRVKRFCDVTAYRSIFFQFFTEHTDKDAVCAMTKEIEQHFPDAYYYGCQSFGNIIDGRLGKDKTLIVCSVFEYETTRTELVYIDPKNPNAKFQSLEDLWAYCNQKKALKSVELTLTYQASSLLKVGEEAISLKPGIQVFGSVAIHPQDIVSPHSWVFTKKEGFSETAAVAILLGGEDLNIKSFHYNGWEGLGKRFTVTKSDGKIIHQIDHEPAMNIYRKYLDIDYNEKFMENTMQFPLLINNHGVECIRLPMPTQNPNDIELTVDIKTGTKIRLSYGEPSSILKTVNDHAKEIFEFAPETIRIYSCAIRRRFWGDNRVSLETSMLDGIAATVGFYTRGEILRVGDYLQYFNATIVACLVREGEIIAPDYELEDIIDRRARQGEFSSKIVHYLGEVTTELEDQYNNTLSGIARAYQNMLHINLKENRMRQFDKDEYLAESMRQHIGAKEQLKYIISHDVVPSQMEGALAYFDLATLKKRMKNRAYIDCEFLSRRQGWFRAQFVAISYDEKGELEEVLLATQIIDEAKKREEELLYLASTDEMTGLYNRRSYEMDMIDWKNSSLGERLVYVSMDVNGLKFVNDTLGHAAGDELIKGAADCMKQAFDKYGKLYRTGGDEFVAVIFASEMQLKSIQKDFKNLVQSWKGTVISSLSISAGYVVKKDYPELSFNEIEKLADERMYEEKVRYYNSKK